MNADLADPLPLTLSVQATATFPAEQQQHVELGFRLSMAMILESMFGPKPAEGWTSSQVEAGYAFLRDGT